MFEILIVEDEQDIRKMMCEYLRNNNFQVYEASDGEKALYILENHYIDLMITDIMMPHMNGYSLTKELRNCGYNLPILMITAKESIEDKEMAYSNGIDDYMVKPIILREMVLRINSLLKRVKINNEKKIQLKHMVLDYESFTIIMEEDIVTLPKKEFLLLFKLLSEPNKIFTKNQIMDEIWGYDSESDDSTIKVHISKLRDKFKHSKDFEIITIKGLGYKTVLLEQNEGY
ncbi:MAG: response regulator transcription factor [Eubacteriales bacterium]